DGLGEVVEGAGVGAGAEERDGGVGPLGTYLVPAAHGGAGRPDAVQIVDRDALRPVVVRMHHDGQGVGGDRQLDQLDAVGGASVECALLDDTAGVGDVQLACAHLREPAAGAR